MPKKLPFQVHVHLNLYAESPDQIQLALKAAYEQLALGIPTAAGYTPDNRAGFSFSVTTMNLDDNRPAPAIPPQVD